MNISYWVDQSYRGKGYGSEASKLAIKDVFNRSSEVTLEFEIAKGNVASIKTFEKACKDLSVSLNGIDQRLECRVIPIDDKGLSYRVEIYDIRDQTSRKLISGCEVSKGKLIKITSKENINGRLISMQERILYRTFNG